MVRMSAIFSAHSTPDITAWPRAAVPPLAVAVLRSTPEDFLVEEQMPFSLIGAGEHLWLKVRKRGFNTEQVAKLLARLASLSRRDIGYAGMKDRHAVTVQWFSLYLPGRPDPEWHALPDGIEVQEAIRHSRKLKTGALAGNRFVIVLRECQGDRDGVQTRIEEISACGVPNYFGEQRFGKAGGNIAAAQAMFSGDLKTRDRKQSGIYLSAARSFLFNELLAQRVTSGHWDKALQGDALSLQGSRSFFVPAIIDATILRRLAERDVHPSGPLWGRGDPPTQDGVRELEMAVAANYRDLAQGLERAGLEQERRALRMFPQDFIAQWLDANTLQLAFSLLPGSYATVLLRELAVVSTMNHVVGEDHL